MSIMKKVYRNVMRLDNSLSRFGIRIVRNYRIWRFEKQNYKVLEISGGRRPLSKAYLNVDASTEPEVDVVTNLVEDLPFKDEYADKIVSVATLEHFTLNDVRKVLAEFLRILKKG